MDLLNNAKEYMMSTYTPLPINIVKGEDCSLFDDNNKKYIDFTSGIGVNSVGYNNQAWKDAIISQLNTFQHLSNIFASGTTVELAKKITELSGMSKVFFSNSGAEANEGAIKLAKKYSTMKYGKERNKVLSLTKSFHGRTLATLKATGQEKFHNYFFPFIEGFDYVEANNIDSLKEKLTDDVCAIMMEAVQGEGGVNPLNKDFVLEACKLANEKDILIIFDEVQCGIGRTGKLFGFNEFNVEADIVTLAKGLGGGLPIGAVLCNEKLANVFVPGDHGSTYGGNPVVCAGALAVLEQICNEEMYSNVKNKEVILRDMITKSNLQSVKEVRGLGLMIGIEIDGDSSAIQKEALKKGLLVLTAGPNVVRLLPPLVISDSDFKTGMNILIETLGAV